MAVDRTVWKIILDFLILAAVAFPLLAILLWMPPYERGFFLNDQTLMLPFKEQQISEAVLAGAGFAIIVVLVLIVEVSRDMRGRSAEDKFLAGSLMPGWLWESYVTIGVFTFGAACQQFTTNLGKYVIGRLRPHFFHVCVPSYDPSLANGYIDTFTCTGSNPQLFQNLRLSFPSAHSSFAMYTAIFLIFYLQVKTKWRGSKLLRHAVQFAALMGAWYVGLSRVVDHMHHWEDVAAGFAIGAAFGVLVFIFVLKPKKYGLPMWDEPVVPHNTLPRPVLAR